MKRWLPLQFKRMWRAPGTWAFAVAALVMLIVFSHFFWRGDELAPIGIAGGKGRCADEVREFCLKGKNRDIYRRYHDAKAMREDVLRGRLDCGFVLGDDLDQTVFEETGKPAVTYYHTPVTSRGLIAKEEVYAAILLVKSQDILAEMAEDPKVFAARDGKLLPALLKRQAYYKDSDDIFKVIFDEVSGPAKKERPAGGKSASGRVMMALLLVAAAALAMGRERFGEVYRSVSVVMRKKEKRAYLFSYALAGAGPVLLLMLIALPVSFAVMAGTATGAYLAISMLLLAAVWILASLAAVGLSALVRSQTAYLYAMTILLILFWITMMLMRLLAE